MDLTKNKAACKIIKSQKRLAIVPKVQSEPTKKAKKEATTLKDVKVEDSKIMVEAGPSQPRQSP